MTSGFRRKKVSKGARIRIPTPLAVPPARAVRPRLSFSRPQGRRVRFRSCRQAVGKGARARKAKKRVAHR